MVNLVCVFGYSNSGKSIFASQLEQSSAGRMTRVHCVGHIKRLYEKWYQLPEGSLDTPKGKAFKDEKMITTIGKAVEDLYFFWREHDPYHSTRGLRFTLDSLFSAGKGVILEAIRNPEERVLLKEYLKQHKDMQVIKIWIDNDNAKPLPTDKYQEEIFYSLKADLTFSHKNVTNAPGEFDGLVKQINGCLSPI